MYRDTSSVDCAPLCMRQHHMTKSMLLMSIANINHFSKRMQSVIKFNHEHFNYLTCPYSWLSGIQLIYDRVKIVFHI